MGELSLLTNQMLDNFFVAKTLALEESNLRGAFSKQMHIDNLQSEAKTFIKLHPKGRFIIKAYDEETNEPSMLIITNCPAELVKYDYIIELDPTWTSFRAEQINESGTHKILLRIVSL